MKKFLCILLFILFVPTLYGDINFNIAKQPSGKYDFTTFTATQDFKVLLNTSLSAKHRDFSIWLNYYKLGSNCWGRIYYYVKDEEYDFDEAYTVTMHFLEAFCTENDFRKPVLRQQPEVKRSRRNGIIYTRYEAYMEFLPK